MGKILVALVVLCGLLFIGTVIAGMLKGQASATTTTTTTTTTEDEPYTPPPPDMDPPKLPVPETYSEATQWLQKNAIYEQNTKIPNGCTFLKPLDAATASVSQLQTHIENLTACLVKVWNEPMTAAGFVLPRPPATVYTTPIETACGKLDRVNASYCGGDQRIYYSNQIPRIFPSDLQHARFLMDMVLAHEFGHAIQARTGISVSEMAWEQKVGKAEANVYSRRLEQQADCLAGMFTHSVAPSVNLTEQELATLRKIAYNLGDDVLSGDPNIDSGHGSGKNRELWFTKGLTGTTLIGQCNTFIVPASQVR
ncbi:MAG: neutral zinc metallopeptidase [Micropruina sp.]|nr:MAG: neutral zinc metallopeptidase [Micropruina sp.]